MYEFPRLEYRRNLRKLKKGVLKVNIYKAVEERNVILVEGGMGSGKSRLLRHLVEHFTDAIIFNETHMVPIPVSYKEFADSFGADASKLIISRIGDELRSQLEQQNASYVLLIDGVDEKNIGVEDQVDILTSIVSSIKKSPRTKAVVTARYLKGIDETDALEREIVRYELGALSLSRTIEFITKLCCQLNLASRLIEDLKKSALFQELPKSPVAAIILAKLLNENPKELPSNLTELYSQYIELVLGRWDVNKGLQTQKEYQALDSIMMDYARSMLDYEMPYLTLDDAKGVVISYLSERHLDIDADDLFKKMIERCELITVNVDNRTLAFKHRSFTEFFYAKAQQKTGYANLRDRAFKFYWMNTVFFYLGLLKDCPDQLQWLVEASPMLEAERWIKVINLSNYMMAAYASPYKVITDGLATIMQETARLFLDITTGGIESPFSCLSHMDVLCLLQLLIRSSYSYEFFKTAMEDAALAIDEGDMDESIKAYALFFLNVTFIELGTEKSFDFLLQRYSNRLPLDVALAVQHESKQLKERTLLMRRNDKYIRHLLKDNLPLEAKVEKLYKTPLRLLPGKRELDTGK